MFKLSPEFSGKQDVSAILATMIQEIPHHPDREQARQELLSVIGNIFQGKTFRENLTEDDYLNLEQKLGLCLDNPQTQQNFIVYVNSLLQ